MAQKKASNQDSATGPIVMDSGRFLGAINSSVQAKLSLAESIVKDLGTKVGANWRLAALRGDTLFIEDVNSHDYYMASHRREKGGRVTVDNVRPIRIVESKKKSVFESTCLQLVNAIEENDARGMATAYNKMLGQRFSPRTIPSHGKVKTHDGAVRTIKIDEGKTVDEDIKSRIVAAVIEGISDNVVVKEGKIVSASFNNNTKLPISEWVCRKVIARKMRTVAENAYWSRGFQDRLAEVARCVNENRIVDGVKLVSGFLAENQEFTILNRKRLKSLVENTLATRAILNQQLCNDVTTLLWRTNLKINRDSILKEWKAAAIKAGHSTLLDNVRILSESRNFEQAYESFINLVFNEAIGPRDIQVDAYKTALTALKETPKIKKTSELSGKIDELLERLDQPEADHAVISEVEDLLAEVKNEINAMQNLDNYDQMPGGDKLPGDSLPDPKNVKGVEDDGDDDLGIDLAEPSGGKKSGTTVNFNISINGDDVETGGLGDEGMPEEEEEEDDDDLASLLKDEPEEEEDSLAQLTKPQGGAPAPQGGGGAQLAPGAAPAPGQQITQGRNRNGKIIGESIESWDEKHRNGDEPSGGYYECEKCGKPGTKSADGCCVHCGHCIDSDSGVPEDVKHLGAGSGQTTESLDPYAFNNSKKSSGIGSDYGMKPIQIKEDCARAVSTMFNIVKSKHLADKSIEENLVKLASAGIQSAGLRIPSHRREAAIQQVCDMFIEECQRRVVLGEDQYKFNWAYKGGRRRQRVNKPDTKGPTSVTSEGLAWLRKENTGLLGEMCGTRFVLDHGGDVNLDPAILSEDGSVEVPIPSELHESAFAAARMANGDSAPFLEWLRSNIVQLSPISESDRRQLDEAVINITTGSDGQVEIEVDSDEEIDVAGDEVITEPGEPGIDDAEDEFGDEDGDLGMKPVDIDGEDHEEHEMPDFDSHDNGMPDFEAEVDSEGEGHEEEEEGHEESQEEAEEEEEPEGTDFRHGGHEEEEDGHEEAEEEEDDFGIGEDHDVTDPKSQKYIKPLKDNPRDTPDVPVPSKSDDKLDGISNSSGKATGTKTGSGAASLKNVKPRRKGKK